MKKAYTIQIGLWTKVYQTNQAVIISDKEPTKENIKELIEQNGIDYEFDDVDWGTAETIDFDEDSLQIIEEQEVQESKEKDKD